MSKGNRRAPGNHAGIVIKKEEVVEGEGHGGAWKVAYADFVTAMMAFFLLMWLLNATTEDQRKGLADYFSPNNLLSHASSGTGEPFGGHTAFDHGAMVSDRGAVQAMVGSRPTPLDPSDADAHPDTPERAGSDDDQGPGADQQVASQAPTVPGASSQATSSANVPAQPPNAAPIRAEASATEAARSLSTAAAGMAARTVTSQAGMPSGVAPPRGPSASQTAGSREPTEAEIRAAQERQEKAEFDEAAQQIRDAVGNDPALVDLAKQLVIDMTPEGLRIQIVDAEQRPMFPLGSAEPNERARLLLQKVTPVLSRLPQDISIAGHTDAAPFPGPDRTNWELSTERANATRRLMVEGGLSDARIRSVSGNADRDLLLPKDPLAAANRRIAVIVLRGTGRGALVSPAPSAITNVTPQAGTLVTTPIPAAPPASGR